MLRNVPGVRPTPINSATNHRAGFSLVELMVTIALLGISLALALPSFQDMTRKRQLTNGAEQIAALINTAQGAAMKTNEVVTVHYSRTDNDDWCIGAISGDSYCDCSQTDTTASDYCRIGSQGYVVDAADAGNLELMHAISGDGAYAFHPDRGLLTDLEDSLAVELRSPEGDFRLNVLVNTAGRVMVCSQHPDYGVPGYPECPPAGGDDGTTDPEDPPDGPIYPGGEIY